MLSPSVDFHIQALYSLLKVPCELIKRNFKSIQKLVEKQRKLLAEEVARVNALSKDPIAKLREVRKLILNFKAYKKKLGALVALDNQYRARIRARVGNLEILKQCCVDPGAVAGSGLSTGLLDLHNPMLIQWYRDQTNLLIADYLLRSNRQSNQNTGRAFIDSLSQSFPQIKDLIDYDLLQQFNEIYLSIVKDHDLTKLVAWYTDHHANLRRGNTNMEFEISYCRCLSFIEQNDILGAIKYAQLHLSQYGNQSKYFDGNHEIWERNLERLRPMGGLFVFSLIGCGGDIGPSINQSSWSTQILKNTVALRQYQQLLLKGRWVALANYFVETFTQYYGISASYPLHVYLSAGLTSLKTKSCYRNTQNTIFQSLAAHSQHPCKISRSTHLPSNYYSRLGKINHCPACSPELFDLARLLPHAQLITHIFSQPYMLPNGNIYPFEKLLKDAKIVEKKNGNAVTEEEIKDPLTREMFLVSSCLRVYPA